MTQRIHSLKLTVCALVLSLFCISAFGQQSIELRWGAPVVEIKSDLSSVSKLYFANAFFSDEDSLLPQVVINEQFSGKITHASVKTSNIASIPLDQKELKLIGSQNYIPESFVLSTNIMNSAGNYFVQLIGTPLIIENGVIKKITAFDYEVTVKKGIVNHAYKKAATSSNSVSPLSSGKWYKLAVTKTGIHQLNNAFFTLLGIDLSTVDPRKIRVFGNSEGVLPELNSTPVTEKLEELAITVSGESDGVFNANDYVLFYGVGPHTWQYDSNDNYFNHQYNLYSDTSYYYLNLDQVNGKRIGSQAQASGTSSSTVSQYNNYAFHELSYTNLIQSGKKWLGEYFNNTTNYQWNFAFDNINTSERVKIKSEFAVRSFSNAGNNVSVTINGVTASSKNNINTVSSYYTSRYANQIKFYDSLFVSSSSLTIGVNYSKPQPSSVAWLDYVSVNVWSNLSFSSGQLSFRNSNTIGAGKISTFKINSPKSITIWDVSNPLDVKVQNHTSNSSSISFQTGTSTLKEFIAFDYSSFHVPISKGIVTNQNILAHVNKEYILICPPEFKTASLELAEFHEQSSNLSTAVVTTTEIFNEFGSGIPDPTSIRNFMRYLYNNSSTKPKYLMLMGDGSYDYRNLTANNTNFVPTFQSEESYNPLSSFTSDDFFGMLDDNIEIYSSTATVDIGIGRFPAKSVTEVATFIEKVKNYVNSNSQNNNNHCSTTSSTKMTFGNWKNTMTFVADDGNTEDNFSNSHLNQTETIIKSIDDLDSVYNMKKVYLDAYKKESGPGGGQYPEATREINDKMQNGSLVMSYIGHGGEAGWADERVLSIEDINSWTNFNKLPLYLTATCEFSRFDNPARVAAGEHVILNPNGGAIAMLTTVRLVFGGISNNIGFSMNFFKHNLTSTGSSYNTLGDAVRLTKVESPIGSSFNNRKFALLGDPAVRLAIPNYKVITNSILDENGNPTDTIKALSKVKITGEVLNPDGSASSYDGILFPTVYDVAKETLTLNNNNKGIIDTFMVQNNILFKGKATVKSGKFSFEFIVPKDISYSFDKGKISYYVANQTAEGQGFSQDFRVGGTAENFKEDNTSPTIEVFLNDSNFVNGGLSNESPLLIANLSDENGINTSGNGIGHDIVGILDGNLSQPIVLNEYYEANIDDYKGGVVQYNLSDLEEGAHTLTVKAWDVHNNSAQTSIDFVVANSSSLSLKHVLNYPNPFSTSTSFMFEHNHSCTSIDVQVKVFTISGKLVKTINKTVSGSGNLKSSAIHWDGKDDYGDTLARGVYLYKLEVLTSDGLKDHKIEKLVILN